MGNYEETCDIYGRVKKIHYLSGGAILVIDDSGERKYYGYRDYQGSFLAMAGADGTVFERYAYDPWGKRVKSDDWLVTDSRSSFLINRGYTGHEHIDCGDQILINMNGRVYDPYTSLFFSPDPFIQAPDNWLNYNRYAYCLNNPFKYTDPSGEFILTTAAIIGISIGVAALFGAYTGYEIGRAHGATGWQMAGYVFGGALIGGISGGVSAVVGVGLGGVFAAAKVGGFLAGSVTGMATGAVGGFITGFGTSLLNGDDIGKATLSGLKGMRIGALSGFVIGGLTQGIQSAFQDKGFWTGSENLSKIATETNVSVASKAQVEVSGNEMAQTEYTYTETAEKHLTEFVGRGKNAGKLARPYMKSPLTIQEIMSTGEGIPDATFKGGMNWSVDGTFRGSQGIWELGINPETNVIYHFNFTY